MIRPAKVAGFCLLFMLASTGGCGGPNYDKSMLEAHMESDRARQAAADAEKSCPEAKKEIANARRRADLADAAVEARRNALMELKEAQAKYLDAMIAYDEASAHNDKNLKAFADAQAEFDRDDKAYQDEVKAQKDLSWQAGEKTAQAAFKTGDEARALLAEAAILKAESEAKKKWINFTGKPAHEARKKKLAGPQKAYAASGTLAGAAKAEREKAAERVAAAQKAEAGSALDVKDAADGARHAYGDLSFACPAVRGYPRPKTKSTHSPGQDIFQKTKQQHQEPVGFE